MMDTEKKSYDLALLEESFRKEKSAARKLRLAIGSLVFFVGLLFVAVLGHGMWMDANPWVPNVIGEYEKSARDTLEEKGFRIEIENCYSDTVPEGMVIGQKPASDKRGGLDSEVLLTISMGAQKPEETGYNAGSAPGAEVIAAAVMETGQAPGPEETSPSGPGASKEETTEQETATSETEMTETETTAEETVPIETETSAAETETSVAETETSEEETAAAVAETSEEHTNAAEAGTQGETTPEETESSKAETSVEESAVKETTKAAKKKSSSTGGIAVPNLKGYTYSQAVSKLRSKGLSYKYKMVDAYIGYKKVVKQSPAAGSKVKKGTVVMLYLSRY